jgi:hypothetical protein
MLLPMFDHPWCALVKRTDEHAQGDEILPGKGLPLQDLDDGPSELALQLTQSPFDRGLLLSFGLERVEAALSQNPTRRLLTRFALKGGIDHPDIGGERETCRPVRRGFSTENGLR